MRPQKLLAIAVSSGKVGFVYLSGGDLLDWGLSVRASRSVDNAFEQATRWLSLYRPGLLIIEHFDQGTRKGRHAQSLVAAAQAAATDRHIYLAVLNPADASAVNGEAGWWLIDPLDIHLRRAASQNRDVTTKTIYSGIRGLNAVPTGTPSYIDIADIEFSLNAGTNQRVTTRGTVGGQHGDIYVEGDIRKTAGGDVFAIIDSARNVYFTSGIDLVSTSGKVFFHVYARNGKVYGSKVRVDVNGGQFLIESSDISKSLIGITTPVTTQPIAGLPNPIIFGDTTTANSTPAFPIVPSITSAGFALWTGSPNVTAPDLIERIAPFVSAATAVYGSGGINAQQQFHWTYFASELGLSPENVAAIGALSFDATVYIVDGQPILAFRGSDDSKFNLLGDWWNTNLPNLLGPSAAEPQYAFGAALAFAVRAKYPDLMLTGHSLGGGIAAFAGATFGIPTVTFNPAGVIGVNRNNANVLNIVMEGDPTRIGGSLIGRTVVIEKSLPVGGISYWHSMERFSELVDKASAEDTSIQFSNTSSSRTKISGFQLF